MSVIRRVVHVDVGRQILHLREGESLLASYPVSTAANGLGTAAGSNTTPPGRLRIFKKIGAGAPLGMIFKGRAPTGSLWTPGSLSADDRVLTRVLWLEGAEPSNANTRERLIYIHGTNQEHLLGTPASHGCIRMANTDVCELFELVDEGTEVVVSER